MRLIKAGFRDFLKIKVMAKEGRDKHWRQYDG